MYIFKKKKKKNADAYFVKDTHIYACYVLFWVSIVYMCAPPIEYYRSAKR